MQRICAVVVVLLILLFGLIPAAAESRSDVPVLPEFMDEHGAVMLMTNLRTGAILWANNAAAEYYGYPLQLLMSMSTDTITVTNPEQAAADAPPTGEGKQEFYSAQQRLKSGEIRDVEIYSYPVDKNNHEIMLSIIHDTTEKVALERREKAMTLGIIYGSALLIAVLAILLLLTLRSRERLGKAKRELENSTKIRTSFFNASSDMIYLKDENLRYVFVNTAMERLYNKASDQIIGKGDAEISGCEEAEKIRCTDERALEKREVVVEEVAWYDRLFLSTKFPVLMPDGSSGIGAYIRDVTRERAEEKRREMVYRRQKILADVVTRGFQNTKEQLDYALHDALTLTGSKYGYIYLYEEDKREFTLNSWTSGVMEDCDIVNPATKYPLDATGFWGEVVRQRKPVIVNDFLKPNPHKKGYPAGHVDIKRFVSIPVLSDDAIVAVVGLANRPEPYDDLDVYEMTLLMNGVWNAVKRRELEENMRFERARYLKTLVSIGDGVMVVDKNGLIEMLNPIAERLTGWTLDEARGQHYKEVFAVRHEKTDDTIPDAIADALASGEVQELNNNTMLTSRKGTSVSLEDSAAPILDEEGKVEGVVLVFRDVTARKEQLRQAQYLSFHDALTGLYNRRFFNEEMTRLDTERNLPLSIVMGDINGLKLTNDVFGHAAGDMLLVRIAQVFRDVCRADDIIARWGGDEFVLLLPATDDAGAAKIVSRVKAEFALQRVKAIKGSISMGIACKSSPETDVAQTLSLAEEAMYSNKALEQEEARDSTFGEILRAMQSENSRERAHAEGVSALCQKFGAWLNLPQEEIRRVRDAGYMHDIGKIALDKDLLEAGLNPSELQWREIRRHPIVGFRILNTSDDMVDIAPAVLAHQEHWDGSGYPKELKGEEIPLAARMIAIAEVYDRMTHGTGPVTVRKEEAIAFIRRFAGTRFDPALAEAFADMMERDEA